MEAPDVPPAHRRRTRRMKISAAVTEESGAPFVIEELELDEVRPDEVLVKVGASGICHTDLSMQHGLLPVPMPVVLGHEGAGVVERVGSAVSSVAVGDRVALTFASCGSCWRCQGGDPTTCLEFFPRNFFATRLDGSTSLSRGGRPVHSHFFGQSSFASHAVVPVRSVVKVDADIPFEVAAPLGCGVQTGAGSVLNILQAHPGSSIAIFGVGAVGLSAVMAARLAGCSPIIAVDLNPARLALAQKLGATDVIDAREEVLQQILDLTGGGANYALEMSGSTVALKQAVFSTGAGGVTGVVGAPPFGTEVTLDVNLTLGAGRSVRGIVEGGSVPAVFIPRLLKFWRDGQFPIDSLIETFPFDQINQAATQASEGGPVKPVLLFP